MGQLTRLVLRQFEKDENGLAVKVAGLGMCFEDQIDVKAKDGSAWLIPRFSGRSVFEVVCVA